MIRLDTYSKLPWEKRSDGRYWTHITLGEVGSELKYYSLKDGKIIERIETVSEEGLFNDDSVKSIAGLPVLLTHPKERLYNLNKEGYRVGTILSSVAREDSKLIAEAVIDDWQGVEIIDKLLGEGKIPEASSGYQLKDLLKREDGKLEQIRGAYDHVAAPLLPGSARGGRNIVMRFDSNDAVGDRLYFDIGERAKRMKKIVVRMDSKDVILEDISSETEEVLKFYKNRVDTLTNDLEGVEERLEEVQEEKKRLQDRIDSTPTPVLEIDISQEIQRRMDAWTEVEAIAPNIRRDYKLTCPEIVKLGLKAINPELNLDSIGEDTVEAMWKGVQLTRASSNQSPARVQNSYTDSFLKDNKREDSREEKSAVARRYEEAYKTNRRSL